MGRAVVNAEHLDFLRQVYPKLPLRELTEAFNLWFGEKRSKAQIRSTLKNHKIRCGRSGRFEKDTAPWNKGKRYQAGGRSVKTQFKPGHKPSTWLPVGTEVVGPDGYLKRKVRDDAPAGMSRKNWRFVHILTWEEANGPVPDGHVIAFRDGDKSNCRLDNLVLLTRAESLYLNRNDYSELPDQLRQPMRALARVESRRFELEKDS